MMSLLFLLIFFFGVVLSIYLLNRYNVYLRQQNRKRSQPLPPIGNLETDKEATLVLRSMLKNEGLSRAEIQKTLSQLYKTAAIAELIYTKKAAGGKFLPDQLKTTDIKLFDKIPFDYNKLGYLKLPLLTKQDTRVLVRHWGEPDKHDSPSNLYEKHILKLISK